MEKLYETQKSLFEKLGNLIRNYKADGKDRKKDPAYYGKKIKQLDDWWAQFDANDSKLRHDPDVVMDHQYFIDDSYNRAKDIYEKQIEAVENDQEALMEKLEKNKETEKESIPKSTTEKQSSSFVDFDVLDDLINDDVNNVYEESDDENIPSVVKVYLFVVDEVKSIISIAEKTDVHQSQGNANAQLENLKLVWNDFRLSHRELSVNRNNKKYCVNMSDIQTRYLKVIGKLNDLVNGNTSKQVVQLPKIKLPEFDGEPSNWRAFKDLFDKIVHNNSSISNAIKMQYLKTDHLSPTESNYNTCYELLNNTYENEREIVSSLIDEILDVDIQKHESSAGLKLIHDKTFQCIMSIQSIGTSVDNWDVLLIQILMRKLDKATILDYEKNLVDVKKNQSLEYFLKYLEKRFLALMSAEKKKP